MQPTGVEIRKMEAVHTLDFDRVPPVESIQTYSAMILPCWSSLRYLFSCGRARSQ
jgi:hypothetical protein